MTTRNVSPRVSVVIPTYNGGYYLCQTIESVLAQTFQDIEILVIDDASDQDIASLLRPYKERIQYVRKERSGPASSRNHGIKLARGQYLALLDHDDLWHPDKLQMQVRALDERPQCALAYCYPMLIDGEGKPIPNEKPSSFPSGDVTLDFLSANRITTFSATLIRKSIFEKTGFLDEALEMTTADDYDMWLRISDVAEIVFVPDDLVSYRIHAGNLLKNYDQNLRAHMYVLDKFMKGSAKLRQGLKEKANEIVLNNKFNKITHFAFVYYYRTGGEQRARMLFREAWRMKPLHVRHLMYWGISAMPVQVRAGLRMIKSLWE